MKSVLLEMEKLKNLHSGLGQFCFHLGSEFKKTESLNFNYYVPEKLIGMFGENVNYTKQSILHKFFPLKKGVDIWHCLHQGSDYFPGNKKAKVILTIHDLNFLDKYIGLKRSRKLKTLQKKVNKADALTAISNYAKRTAEEKLDLKGKAIKVIYNGNSLQTFQDSRTPGFIKEGAKFLFSLGIIQPKKNFHVLIPFLKQLEGLNLVIAGNSKSEYAKEIIQKSKEAGLENRVILPGNISEEEKYWLYKNCEAFVFPSLSEGFGLPVVEAMSLGKPVFLANSSSLPEIGGKEAFYWDDFDPANMKKIYESGVNEYADDAGKKERIKLHASQFSWENAAKEYISLYNFL